MGKIEHWIGVANAWLWGPPLVLLLAGTHLFLTIRFRFIQRYIFHGIRLSLHKEKGAAGDVSPFGALTTALAATIGAGNIVGVATAIAAGGPGAAFWMWIAGIFGIATKYGEAVLAIRYRVQMPDGSYAGGPMYVLEHGLGLRSLAIAFSLFTVCAGFGMANLVQANTIVSMTQAGLPGVTPSTIAIGGGVILALATAAVILGGIRSISRVSNYLVPFMALGYIVACLVILGLRWNTLGDTIATIVTSAFKGQAAIGGFLGAGVAEAMRFGVARGLFSNESGLGSAPIAAAAARTSNPVRQGLVSATGTFWDTVIVCALTSLVIVSSGAWESGLQGAALVRESFASIGQWATWALNLSLALFVFTSIIGWSYYVEKALEYVFGSWIVRGFRWVWVAAVFLGANLASPAVWDLADLANGLMAIPNLVALLLLSHVVVQETKANHPANNP